MSERDETAEQSGTWIGSVRGVRVRYPGDDCDGPVVEFHGENGLAAMEFDDPAFIEGLTDTAAEMQMIFDEMGDE